MNFNRVLELSALVLSLIVGLKLGQKFGVQLGAKQ